jgi:hypothetical protein
MAKISYEWEDLWAIFDNLIPEAQKDALESLASMLKTASPKSQKEALESAPMPIIKAHAHLLHDKARKALGLEEGRGRMTKINLKEFSIFG